VSEAPDDCRRQGTLHLKTSTTSRSMRTFMNKAATGSAHHQPAHAFSVRPMIGPPKRRWQRMRGKQEPSLELGRDPGRYSARNRQPDPDVLPQCHQSIAKW